MLRGRRLIASTRLYSLKALDPKRPIREADITRTVVNLRPRPCHASLIGGNRRRRPSAAVEVRPAPGLVEVDAKN